MEVQSKCSKNSNWNYEFLHGNWFIVKWTSISKIERQDGIEDIGCMAFGGCKELTEIELPAGITRIEAEIFSGDSALKSVIIPEGVTSIVMSAFASCDALMDVYYTSVYENGLMTGMNENTFAPNETLTRAQFASILYRANGAPEVTYESIFNDVAESDWHAAPIIWAYQEGVVSGLEVGKFDSDNVVTREQMAVMMYNYAAYKGYDTGVSAELNSFEDAENVKLY